MRSFKHFVWQLTLVNEESKTRDIAKVVSNLLHPYVVLAPVVALVAYQGSSSPEIWLKWTVAALLPAYLFPLLYMQARVILMADTAGAPMTFRSLFREKPGEMFILACLFGIPSTLILYSLGSPNSIIATMVGLTATALVIALVNRGYRGSLHLAFLTSMVTAITILFGTVSLIAMPLIPLLGISRYQSGEHTLWQLIVGFLLGLIVTVAVFRGFGILG